MEVWYHLILTFFVPPGHVESYKFASKVTLPGLSPSQAHEVAEKGKGKKKEEGALKKSLDDARKGLNEVNDALSMNKEIPSNDAIQAQLWKSGRCGRRGRIRRLRWQPRLLRGMRQSEVEIISLVR